MTREYSLFHFIGGGFWPVSKDLTKAFGCVNAIWITVLAEVWGGLIRNGAIEEDDWFYFSRRRMQEETGLSPHQQKTAMDFFIDKRLISMKRQGIPSRNYYKIRRPARFSNVVDSLILKNLRSTTEKTEEHINNNLVNKNVGKYNLPNSSIEAISENDPDNKMTRTTKTTKNKSDPEYPDLKPGQHWAVEYWNKLKLTPKHPNPTTKTYKRCANIFNQLEKGTFAKGPRRKKILNFIKQYNLPYRNTKWTRDMVREALDKMRWLFENNHFRKGQHNLANLLYNPRSPKGFYSPFLYHVYYFKKIKKDIELGGGPHDLEDIDGVEIWLDKRKHYERLNKKRTTQPHNEVEEEAVICLPGHPDVPLMSKEKGE